MALFGKNKKTTNPCCCGEVDDLIVKKDDNKSGEGCCNGNCDCNKETEDMIRNESKEQGTVIKILGSGCKNCITLAENVKTALEEMKLQASMEKVTDFTEITRYGVMSTPALVVSEKVVSYGKVLKPQEVVKILEKVL